MILNKSKHHSAKWLFINEAIKGFRRNGSILPSSKFLTENMLRPIKMRENILIIELGAGTGIFTWQIIEKMPENATLIVVESNPTLVKYLETKIKDRRVHIIEDDAASLEKYLLKFGYEKADYVISGLPLGNMKKNQRQEILLAIKNSLKDQGTYIQFQYLLSSLAHVKKIFRVKSIEFVFLNVPPAFVYVCVPK